MHRRKELLFILSIDYVLLSIVLTQYLEERDPDNWSYAEFLNLNRDAIIKLPPFNAKWTSLDGTWHRRFLQEARKRDPASVNILKERIKSEQNMKYYWEKMIIEQKELSVKRTHISGSLDLLNDAGDYNTQRLRDQGFNEDEEGKSSGKALRKRKNVCYTEETETDSDYSDYSGYEWKPNKKSYHIEKSVNQTEFDIEKFEELYLAMDPNYMWTLESGRKVETVIYEFAKSLREESYLHSFIINDADVDTKSLFSRDEWEEIKNFEVIDRPKLDPCHKELLKKYTVDNMKKLRSLLFESFTPDGKEYDRDVHFDLDYINSAYRGILYIWEMDEDPFDASKLEGWFQMNVWSRIIDPAFCNLIDVIRGEGMSIASSERKNVQRKIHDRKKIGKKGDGVFRLRKDHWEFGAIEAGRKWEGLKGTKYMTDSLKLCKMLKDMLDKLFVECEMKKNIVEKLKVIGILHGANRIQVITVDHPKGYVTRINRNKIQEVAGRLTNSKPLALVLKEILYAKSVIVSTLDVFNKRNYINIETFLDDDDGYHIPEVITTTKTFTTPHNARTKDITNEIKDK
ncbi:10046_t:CDS:2 [Cetraspora pellucida]|uniref:10046_t:CDS:1 n=1 Tax=Cetraspora pellucida TaxID=1433469 RepID=A0A9N9NQ45_9GLOM|nr:10046_t:CDS:2 [Cetraspora pellucida]